MATPDIHQLDLSDSEDVDELFRSPSKRASTRETKPTAAPQRSDAAPPPPRMGESRYDAEAAREAALQKELEGVRNINSVIEGVLASLERAQGNMSTVSTTVSSASELLNTWTRILSQTEHNQRLILNENWKGTSQDVADMENEVVLRAQAAERRAAEEERRKEEAKRRAEDEERQRQAGTATRGVRGTRGRGRGVGRGSTASSGYGNAGGRGSSLPPPRAGSGIGRGLGSTRGRGRGVR